MDYIDKFRELRQRQKLSQRKLSAILGVSEAVYGNYENRNRKMDIDTFVKLCRFFEVSADEILGLK